jgi:hypothetical protein
MTEVNHRPALLNPYESLTFLKCPLQAQARFGMIA